MESLSNIEKTINGFQSMTVPLDQIHFERDFFEKISQQTSIITSPKQFNKFSSISKPITVDLIRELSIKLKKKPSVNLNPEFLTKLNLFLKHYQFVVSLKRYFHEKIFTQLYSCCYLPHEFYSVNQNDEISDDYTVNIFLTEIDLNLSDKDKSIRNIINSEQKLSIVFNKLTSLLEGDCANTELMDSEQLPNFQSYDLSIRFCCQLFDDLNNKIKQIIELAHCWINNYKIWSDKKIIYNNYSEYSNSIVEKINQINVKITQLNIEIENLKSAIVSCKSDFDDLQSKESNLLTIISDSHDIFDSATLVNSEYELLLKNRSELIDKLNNSISGTYKYQELSKSIQDLEKQINDKYQELKLIHYSLKMSQENSLTSCDSLKDFTRWSETRKQSIGDLEKELAEKLNLKNYQEICLIRISDNITRMRLIVGTKAKFLSDDVESISNCGSNGFTMKTYTINDEDRRFGDTEDFLAISP